MEKRESKHRVSGAFFYGKRGYDYEVGAEYFNKESLLYGREKDYSQGADAPFRGLPAAEGIGVY